MEETKNKVEYGRKNMKCEWKVELVKWYQLQLHIFTLLENLIVISFMIMLCIANVLMWNSCMIRQTVEELKFELKRLK